jgi:signal transduction histidine kinase
VPRGALIGRSIASPRAAVGEGADTAVVRAFALRSPFRDASFTIGGEGALAGEWMMSGVPAFEPADGRFAGYRGIAQRRDSAAAGDALEMPALADPASLRELVHEIKTPLNAIIGFAEIIDGQYLGPADRPYRQRAAHIVGQARILLEAIDDLDFAAKSRSAPGGKEAKAALGSIVEEVVAGLGEGAEVLALVPPAGGIEALIVAEVAERIIRRTLVAVIAASEPGERLRLSVERSGERVRVSVGRPRVLRALSVEQLFGIRESDDDSGLALRLARSLARIAGVALVAGERDIALLFDRA